MILVPRVDNPLQTMARHREGNLNSRSWPHFFSFCFFFSSFFSKDSVHARRRFTFDRDMKGIRANKFRQSATNSPFDSVECIQETAIIYDPVEHESRQLKTREREILREIQRFPVPPCPLIWPTLRIFIPFKPAPNFPLLIFLFPSGDTTPPTVISAILAPSASLKATLFSFYIACIYV